MNVFIASFWMEPKMLTRTPVISYCVPEADRVNRLMNRLLLIGVLFVALFRRILCSSINRRALAALCAVGRTKRRLKTSPMCLLLLRRRSYRLQPVHRRLPAGRNIRVQNSCGRRGDTRGRDNDLGSGKRFVHDSW